MFFLCFAAHPQSAAKFDNETIQISGILTESKLPGSLAEPNNPSPGLCLPVIVNFCLNHKVQCSNYHSHFFFFLSI